MRFVYARSHRVICLQGCMPKAKFYRRTWTEKDLQDAIDYLRSGHTKNLSLAADKHNVPCTTLCNRWLGLHGPAQCAHEHQQHLNDTKEHVLCEWIEHRSQTGRPLNK